MKLIISLLLLFYSSYGHSLPYDLQVYKSIPHNYDLEKSWINSEVYVPNKFFKGKIDRIDTSIKLPVVILAHGCTGITEHERSWANLIKKLNFIVIIPDSMSIPNRLQNCDPQTHKRDTKKSPIYVLRPAEIEFMLDKLQEQLWVDTDNIFIMGHSEGGYAATTIYNHNNHKIKGIIISGYNCRFGVKASLDTAILAIEWSDDPWFPPRRYPWHFSDNHPPARCNNSWGVSRPNTSHVLLDGTGHSTYNNPIARKAVIDFLQVNRN